MSLSRHPIPGPDRPRQGTMGDALEARVERVLDHLRGPLPGRGDLLTEDAGNTVGEIDPWPVAGGLVQVAKVYRRPRTPVRGSCVEGFSSRDTPRECRLLD